LAAKGAREGITTAGGLIGRGADFAEKMLGLDKDSPAAQMIRDSFKDVTGTGPMNQIGGRDFNIAADAVQTPGVGKEGGEQEKLRMLLLNASGQDIGGGKKRFGKGATVATEIDRIAGIIAKQSDPSLRGDKDQAAYKAALVAEFKEALGQINVKIDLGDEAAKVFGSAKEVEKSIRNMNYQKKV
jgi:hypothetical protein